MNAFFEGIGRKFSQTGQDAVKKTKDLAEISRINSQMTEEEKKLNKLYMKLGQLYYQMNKETADAVYLDIFQAIGGCLQTMDRYQVMVDEIRGIKKCSRCQTEVALSSMFCPTCGNKLSDDRETGVSTICPDCGMENGSSATTCMKCGKLL